MARSSAVGTQKTVMQIAEQFQQEEKQKANETPWETKNDDVNQNHQNALLPPRLRHMCTSNLENLNADSEGLSGNHVSDSLLGDVFADFRDIIKGTDLWDQNNDAKRLQENFKIIYGKIKGTLGAKYARDDPPYTNLRQNWWEAMKCRIPELRAVPDKQGYLRHKLECS
ncbi:hypothetical protein PFBG_01246 [Plasmodium falciparum 7G8]|uniref:Duffy-antigen binding domain-containing protein n=1 Tax=Plasmodium falciparum (isolate 7G8) TaxID=57266 RepID=W7FH19_PLAF8|nr:hypothetical protein PFBG_01246 [Plasmodium falciparum 7G8]